MFIAGRHRDREAAIGINRSWPITIVATAPTPARHFLAQAAQRVIPLVITSGTRSVVRSARAATHIADFQRFLQNRERRKVMAGEDVLDGLRVGPNTNVQSMLQWVLSVQHFLF